MQVCDEVFTYPDAFSEDRVKISLGRIYRQWKKSHHGLDPTFDHRKYKLQGE